MKRIIPILLVIILLIACMVSCGKRNVETETETVTVEEVKPKPTTTTGPPTDGISEEDDGWSYWGVY